MPKDFAHLHLHTEFSLLDGAIRIKKLFSRCKELGMSAVAITDHGNMYGAMTFYEAYKKFHDKNPDYAIKPIIGCEIYTVEDRFVKDSRLGKEKRNHLILLCKNVQGYHNLVKICSAGFTEGFYYKPRVDFSVIEKYHEGLICLSACVAGELPQAILSGDLKKADGVVKRFKKLFGDDYFVEIQDHGLKSQKTVLPYLISIAKENNVKIVATNDCHYLEKKDAITQKILQCISFGTQLSSEEFSQDKSLINDDGGIDDDSYFPTDEFYLKSREEMEATFQGLGDEPLDNTLLIASRCEDICADVFGKRELYPLYKTPDGSSSMDYLRRLTMEGLKKKFDVVTDEILQRANYELSIIQIKNFPDYFLVVWDYINYAESVGIPVGPGRGSGAGSLVAYAIGITKINPLQFDLYFERFLNPERVSNPDFDIDFCVDRREEVIDYVRNKYGSGHVSQICTFGTMAAKQAIKDVGRVLNIPFSEMNAVTALMPKMMGHDTIENILGVTLVKEDDQMVSHEVPEFRQLYESNPQIKKIVDYAIQIEGMPRQTGLHAAGVIICRDPISEHAPLSYNADKKIACQYNMTQIEALGMLKMDFLGLRNLTDIKKACDLVEKRTGRKIDFYSMGYDDAEVYKMISDGDTHAVFQLENEGMTGFMKNLRPDCIEDLIAGISLYRPGPMKEIPTFIANKKNNKNVKYSHPVLKQNLENTYGVMVYQEQVMNICRDLAGYSMGGADNVRRMMSKKKTELLEAEEKNFVYGGLYKKSASELVPVPGAIANGMDEKDAKELFAKMKEFGKYAFNKSHAAAYAVVAYQTAYLKRYYLKEFMVSVLNNRITNIGQIKNHLNYLKSKGVRILPPDINRSEVGFSVDGDGVRVGLAAIKGVGTGIMEEIINERNAHGLYKNLPEFLERLVAVGVNSRLVENLIFAGAFDSFGHARSVLQQSFPILRDQAVAEMKARSSSQLSMFDDDMLGLGAKDLFKYPDIPEWNYKDKLRMEKEVAGIYLTGHPLEKYIDKLSEFKINSSDIAQLSAERSEDMEGEETLSELSGAAKELVDKASVKLGGMIISAEKRQTKNGSYIGQARLEDMDGTVSLMISSSKINSVMPKLKVDKLVTILGKLAYKDDGREPSVWVDDVIEWDESDETGGEKKEQYNIYLKIDGGVDSDIYDLVAAVFDKYPGKDPIYIQNGKVLQKLSDITADAKMCEPELLNILGVHSVKIGKR